MEARPPTTYNLSKPLSLEYPIPTPLPPPPDDLWPPKNLRLKCQLHNCKIPTANY